MGPIIDLTTLFPWRILLLFAYSVAFFNIYRGILKDKFHPFITFLAVFTARIITSVIFYNREPYDVLGYPSFAVLCFIILLFLTEGKIHDKILAIVTALISQFICVGINGLICIIVFGGKEYSEIFGTENNNLDYLTLHLSSCIVFVIVGILFGAILKFIKKRRTHTKNQNSKLLIYLSVFPISHILFIIIPFMIVPVELDGNYLGLPAYIGIFVLFAIIMIFDCTFPFMINYFEKIIEKNNEYEKELLKNTMDYHQMRMIKQEKQEFRKIKHDFANILTTAKGFIEINKPEKALSILSNTNDDLLGLAGFSICSNETINTIIYIKKNEAEKSSIQFMAEIIDTAPVDIDDYDLCRLLHNIIDNSLNAAHQLNDNKVSKISVNINQNKIIIRSENRFNKINEERKKKTKTDEHGNGIGIIKEICKKYDGDYNSKHIGDVWYTETILDNKQVEKQS